MIVISIIFLILALVCFSLKEKEIEFSEFELQRRIDSGDKRAEKMLNKKKFAPIYNYFLNYFAGFLMIISVVSLSKAFEFWQTLAIAFFEFLICKILLKSGILTPISVQINRKIIPTFLGIYIAQSSKTKNRLTKLAVKKQPWAFYSKEELLFFLGNHKHILGDDEQKWVEKIFELSQKTVFERSINGDKLAIVHANDLLTPAIIDELFKTKQKIFPVMDKSETEIRGVIFLDDITEVGAKDSQTAKIFMKTEFFEMKSSTNALVAFEKMLTKGENHAILTEKNGDLAGIVQISDFLRKK